ncbi:IS110 family transposase [Spirosoma aerophilum]
MRGRPCGIDIAKATLDWAVYDGKKIVLQTTTSNTIASIKTALRLLKALPRWTPQRAIFCMEHTGIYNAHLLDFLQKLHFPIWLESSLQIKKTGVCNGVRPTARRPCRLMPSVSLSTLFASAISFVSGNRPVKWFKS